MIVWQTTFCILYFTLFEPCPEYFSARDSRVAVSNLLRYLTAAREDGTGQELMIPHSIEIATLNTRSLHPS
jgi:hypothetical protein